MEEMNKLIHIKEIDFAKIPNDIQLINHYPKY